MFHRIFFIGIIIALLGFASCNTTGSNSDEIVLNSDTSLVPNLEYLEDFFDFGTIYQGEIVSHAFRFKNSGNGVLVIKDVIPSCGCTTMKLSSKILKPNEEAYIEVVFNSKGWYGSQYKSVTLRTNSAIWEKSVTIKANVVEGKN